jgi:hypothetical protein
MVPKLRMTIGVACMLLALPLFLLAQTASAGPGSPKALSASERSALLTTREAVWKAWFANDQAQLESLLPREVIAINYGDTLWYDRQGVLRGAHSNLRGRRDPVLKVPGRD